MSDDPEDWWNEAFTGDEWRVREIRDEPFETIRSVSGSLAVLDRVRDGT